jgi:hypothetical protein
VTRGKPTSPVILRWEKQVTKASPSPQHFSSSQFEHLDVVNETTNGQVEKVLSVRPYMDAANVYTVQYRYTGTLRASSQAELGRVLPVQPC